MFQMGSAGLVALNSLGLVPKPSVPAAGELSRRSLVVAIAALGMKKTTFKALIAAGWRPVAVMVATTLWICAPVLAALMLWAWSRRQPASKAGDLRQARATGVYADGLTSAASVTTPR